MRDRIKVVLIVVVAIVVLVASLTYLALAPSPSKSLPTPPTSLATCSPSSGNATYGNWTTYHQNNARTGIQSGTTVTGLHAEWTGPTGLDGQVYAEPLVCGTSIFVATEDDSVYAINATSGAVEWRTNLGTPMPGSSLPCGDISPSGITGTPVIDVATGTLYAVAFVTPGHHVLFGLDVGNGSVESQVVVDPAAANPLVEQQRGALTLANGYVYVVYGGLYGDCGDYHGWVVGVPASGTGSLVSYQVPTQREGGIWGTAGTAVAANGDLYVATGNGANTSAQGFDHGDSVIELSPNLTELGYFAPSNWAYLNSNDLDLGSVAPTILPNSDLFQIGKEGVGYLLNGSNLGGIGGEIANVSVCPGEGAYGGTAHAGFSVFVPCMNGLFAVVVGASTLSVIWHTSDFFAGSPIVTGGIVWSVSIYAAELLGFNVSTGQQVYSYSLGSADHFISPAAAPGSLFVGAGDELYGFSLA